MMIDDVKKKFRWFIDVTVDVPKYDVDDASSSSLRWWWWASSDDDDNDVGRIPFLLMGVFK